MFSNFFKHVPGTLAHSIEQDRQAEQRRAVAIRARHDAPRSYSSGNAGYSIASYSDGGHSSSSCSSDSGSGGGDSGGGDGGGGGCD